MTDLIGRSLGPYQIVEQIGAGGMATVYKAYQPAMQRYVAVKVLPAHLASDTQTNFRDRFQREANVIARLEHRYILPVYDVGEDAGISYLVMRYTDGGTLGDLIASRALAPERALTLIEQVAEALAYAHGQGVIHRDIKPANILIGRDGNALLSDFGIAKILEDTFATTGYGVAIGTPSYMSPEQAEGKPIDGRTDIYALGVVLYQALTGEPPFSAQTPLAVMMMHIHNPLRPPREVNPAISAPVEQVILRALAKRPEDRFPSADAMAEALRAARGSSASAPPIPAPPSAAPRLAPATGASFDPPAFAPTPLPSDTPPRRSRTCLVLTGVLALLLVLGIGAAFLGLRAVGGLLQSRPTALAARPVGEVSRPTTVEVDPTPAPNLAGGGAQSRPSGPPANAIPIAIGDEIQEDKPAAGAGKIAKPGEHDVYTFTATPGQQVYFQLKAHDGLTYVNWRLEDQDGTALFDQCLGCGEVGLQTLKRGGTYVLTVGSDKAAEVGTYRFRLWNVPPAQQMTVAIGDTISEGKPGAGAGSIEVPGAHDVYTFTANPGQQVFFQLKAHDGLTYVNWRLEDQDGTVLFDQCLGCGEVGLQTLKRGGGYTLTVGGDKAPEIGTYAFKLWDVPPASTFAINIGDEVSEGKPGAGAGSVEVPGAHDVYTFTANPGQQVFFQLKAHDGLTYVNWRLEDQDGTVLFDQCLGCGEVGLQTLKRGGSYTLTVGGDKAPEIGTYAFQIVAQ